MLNQNEIVRLKLYISGKADEKDIDFVESLFSHGQENFDLRNHLEKEWESDHQFSLPDGTVGWLNSGSSLTYSIPFNNNRKVTLDSEACFDVTPNEKSPFEISAGNSKIKVLGTRFNISAYRGAQYIAVVLQQGKVEFYPWQSQKITMSPSQRLVFRNGKNDLTVLITIN